MKHTSEEIKYRLSDLGAQIGNIAIEYITELEKENAELKDYNKYLKRQRQGGIQKQYNKVAIIKQQDEQLTKSKELLTRFVMASVYFNGKETDLVEEAEQFLKEIKE